MKRYSAWRPTGLDSAGLACEDRQDWLVLPVGRNRDSDCLSESNWATTIKRLGGDGEDVEIHRFGHWACGWFEIVMVRPGSPAEKVAEDVESDLDAYPILDESDLGEREQEAANETWRTCYSTSERIAYMRKHRSQFEFRDMRDLVGCVRGRYFAGYASELLG